MRQKLHGAVPSNRHHTLERMIDFRYEWYDLLTFAGKYR